MRSPDDCVMAITYGFQGTMLRMTAEANPDGIPYPPTPPGSQEPTS
jgi:hypothetical protein